jgi:hypothetical protein
VTAGTVTRGRCPLIVRRRRLALGLAATLCACTRERAIPDQWFRCPPSAAQTVPKTTPSPEQALPHLPRYSLTGDRKKPRGLDGPQYLGRYVDTWCTGADGAPEGGDTTLSRLAYARRALWDCRAGTIAALASLGDPRTIPLLTESLNAADWRVTLTATRALAQQGPLAQTALPALAAVERTHWLPQARARAGEACAQIESATRPSHAKVAPETELEPSDGACADAHPAAEGWTPTGGTEAWPPGIPPDWLAPSCSYVPHRFDDGILLGTVCDEGEGDLWWFARGREREPIRIAEGAALAIVPRPWGLVVLRSFAMSSHTVCVVERSEGGGWQARPLLQLPGWPTAFRLRADGGLTIATTNGTLMLGSGGAVERFACKSPP